MTFKDIVGFVLLFALVGCSAPEVRPPEPSPSPRELGTLGISNAQADSLPAPAQTIEPPPEEQFQAPASTSEKADATQQPSTEVISISFPAQGKTLQENIALTGPGGRDILTLERSDLSIQVLEDTGDRYRVICLHCDPDRPYQAGFIAKEFVEITH